MQNTTVPLNRAKSLPGNPSYKEVLLKRANSLPTKYNEKQKLYLEKIFKKNINKYLSELSEEKQNSLTIKSNERNVYYFIGRLNPPHAGHIKTLKSLIETAKKTNGKVIILLGSGPNRGVRTLDDPLDFETKRQVVIALLGETYTSYESKIDIIEMGKAADQISNIIQQDIGNIRNIIKNINTFRFSSTKEGDDKKLNWIETAIKKRVFTAPNGDKITINTDVIGIIPSGTSTGKSMSATQVRKDALTGFITDGRVFNIENPGQGYQLFNTTYGEFYGPLYTPQIYAAIVGQAAGLTQEQIQTYIDSDTLPKRGGSRAKVRKTKRRKSRRRRRLTKRRKSKRRHH